MNKMIFAVALSSINLCDLKGRGGELLAQRIVGDDIVKGVEGILEMAQAVVAFTHPILSIGRQG